MLASDDVRIDKPENNTNQEELFEPSWRHTLDRNKLHSMKTVAKEINPDVRYMRILTIADELLTIVLGIWFTLKGDTIFYMYVS